MTSVAVLEVSVEAAATPTVRVDVLDIWLQATSTALPTTVSVREVWLEAYSAGNQVPIARAGADKVNIEPWSTVTLDGSASEDFDGTISTYTWTQTAGPAVVLTGAGAVRTFEAPGVTSTTTLTFSLVVNDGTQNSPADTVNVTVLYATEQAVVGGVTAAVRRTPV